MKTSEENKTAETATKPAKCRSTYCQSRAVKKHKGFVGMSDYCRRCVDSITNTSGT
jgi:hypothetical protein